MSSILGRSILDAATELLGVEVVRTGERSALRWPEIIVILSVYANIAR